MSRVFAACLLLVFAATAQASQQGVVVEQRWKLMDKCAKAAQTAFPDYTAEDNAKRDAKLNECLSGQVMPPREQLAPGR